MHIEANLPGLRELDRRSGGGLEVTLIWSERTGSVFVCVDDEQTSTGFHFAVDPTDALEAFHHPYAYRPGRVRTLPRRTERGAAAA
jgi:hypothetical protein